MDQLSMPYRIALAGLLVFALAWFAVLRPKADEGGAPAPVTATQAPGTAGLGRAVDQAQGAVAATQAGAAQAQSAAGQATGGAAAPAATAAKPAAAAATAAAAAKPRALTGKAARRAVTATDSSAPVLGALAEGKVAVVLFSGRAAADDRHVRGVVRRIDRHRGKVAVFSASIDAVGRYGAITRGVEVMQGPTLLVIGTDHQARTIVGYTDVAEVDQLVDDIGRFRA